VPTRPESDLFITRTIRLVSLGIFLLGMIVLVIYPSALEFSRALARDGFRRQIDLRFAWVSFLGGMAMAFASGGAIIGIFPVFQKNITKFKRIILLILCLLPLAFFLASQGVGSSELGWRVVRTGIFFCVPGWVVNGPAILTGRPFLQVIWRVMCALHLTSRDYAEWS
jgi:hypothetical protein